MTTRQAIRPTFQDVAERHPAKTALRPVQPDLARGPMSRDAIHSAARVKEITEASAGPRMPRAGRPNQPNVRPPVRGICSAAVSTSA